VDLRRKLFRLGKIQNHLVW